MPSTPSLPSNRLGSLLDASDDATLNRLYGRSSQRFDRVLAMAARYFDVGQGAVAVVRGESAWLKATYGFEAVEREFSLRDSFMRFAFERGPLFVIEDAVQDPQFRRSVTGFASPAFFASRVLYASGGTAIGVFFLADARPRRFGEQERWDFEFIAEWIQDELLQEQDRHRAAEVQSALLPRTNLDLAGFQFAGACRPAREVGGDFYDWYLVRSGEGAAVTLADVMGKGIGAAIIAATVRAALRGARDGLSTAEAVGRIADLLDDDLDGTSSFVTAFYSYIRFRDGYLEYVDAGHGLALHVRGDGGYERLVSGDLPFGTMLTDDWQVQSSVLERGDTLVAFSDGLLDVFGDLETTSEMIAAIAARASNAGALVDELMSAVAAAPESDDVTVVAVRRA